MEGEKKTSDLNPEDLQGGISALQVKMEDGASEEMYVTYNKQRNHIMNLQEQLDESRHVLDTCCKDLNETWMDIEDLKASIEDFHIIIKELLTKKKHLEVQLENARMFGGPHADKPDVEEEQIAQAVEEKEQEPSVDTDVQTKSWWRRQCKKMVKAMGTFPLRVKRCLGVKPKKPVARLIDVQPVNSSTMNINMLPVSVGMPPVSV